MLINDDVSKYLHVIYQLFFNFLKVLMMVITCGKFQVHTISLSKIKQGGGVILPPPLSEYEVKMF